MSKRINKDGTLNYFEIIKDCSDKRDFITLSVVSITIISSIVSILCLNEYSFEQNLFKILFLLGLLGIFYHVFVRANFYEYKKNKYEKDLKKASKISKKAYKNLQKNMYKLEKSIFMYK